MITALGDTWQQTSHKLLHTTKLTYTNNGCSAPNAGLQLSCPMCMASLCEPNICCTSASKPGGGKRGRLGGSLQSHLKYCSCINNSCPLKPSCSQHQLLLQGGKNNIMLLGRAQNSNHSSGWPTRYVFLVQLDQRDDKKNKKLK